MTAKKIFGLLLMLLGSTHALADTIAVNPKHPERYVVAKGDNLWDISSRFLRDPWRWPDVWGKNPQISNPHLIYPGDIISLIYRDGKPELVVTRSDAPYTRLSPRVRTTPLDETPHAIQTIPMDVIQQFLDNSIVLNASEYETGPYLVSMEDGRIIGGTGNNLYARNIEGISAERFQVFHSGQAYKSPSNPNEVLGYEATYVGEARMVKKGDPATLTLTSSRREALIGDRLLPASASATKPNFTPRVPTSQVSGKIISVVNGVSRIGQHMTVVIDRGARDGLESGHVLAVDRAGATVLDRQQSAGNSQVKLPDERAGLLMVYRAFDRVSLALVMSAEREMRLYDNVRTP